MGLEPTMGFGFGISLILAQGEVDHPSRNFGREQQDCCSEVVRERFEVRLFVQVMGFLGVKREIVVHDPQGPWALLSIFIFQVLSNHEAWGCRLVPESILGRRLRSHARVPLRGPAGSSARRDCQEALLSK